MSPPLPALNCSCSTQKLPDILRASAAPRHSCLAIAKIHRKELLQQEWLRNRKRIAESGTECGTSGVSRIGWVSESFMHFWGLTCGMVESSEWISRLISDTLCRLEFGIEFGFRFGIQNQFRDWYPTPFVGESSELISRPISDTLCRREFGIDFETDIRHPLSERVRN